MPTVLTAAAGLVALALLRRSVVVKARRAEAERRRIARRASYGLWQIHQPETWERKLRDELDGAAFRRWGLGVTDHPASSFDAVYGEPAAHFLIERDGKLAQLIEDRRVRVGNREVWI